MHWVSRTKTFVYYFVRCVRVTSKKDASTNGVKSWTRCCIMYCCDIQARWLYKHLIHCLPTLTEPDNHPERPKPFHFYQDAADQPEVSDPDLPTPRQIQETIPFEHPASSAIIPHAGATTVPTARTTRPTGPASAPPHRLWQRRVQRQLRCPSAAHGSPRDGHSA